MQNHNRAHSHRIIGSVIYDGLIILGLLMIVGFFAVAVHYQLTGKETIESSLVFQLSLIFVIVGYFFYFWRVSGQTVGMKAWRIKLISIQDPALSFQQMTIRLMVAIPAYGCLLLGVIWQYWSKDQLNWHDKVSQTKLVYLPKC